MKKDDIIGRAPKAAYSWMATVGLLLIVAGIVIPISYNFTNGIGSQLQSPLYKYVYAAGALLLLVDEVMTPYTGTVLRIKRLMRMETWAPIFFCVGAFFLFYTGVARDWIAFTLAGGAILVYTSIMIPIAISRELRKHTDKQ